jgi:malonate decarboxylase beta subunit
MLNSFVELNGRDRARALLDVESFRELLDPFTKMFSPHLEPQGIVPQSDDGVILVRGQIAGRNVLIVSTEGAFQGGGIGEVNGAKISGALELVLEENQRGNAVFPVMIFDTGGVRLQEANYGLLSISEIADQVVALRDYVPVVGVIPGRVGAFGGMSIVAELCTHLIATKKARLALNGPEVIEQEAGVMEFDSRDNLLIWNTIGASQRLRTGLIDEVVEDNTAVIRSEIEKAFEYPIEDVPENVVENVIGNAFEKPMKSAKTTQIDFYLSLLAAMDMSVEWTPTGHAEQVQQIEPVQQPVPMAQESDSVATASRGYRWFSKLTNIAHPRSPVSTVYAADALNGSDVCRYVAIVPDANNRFKRVRNGEVGLMEGWAVAAVVLDAIKADEGKEHKRPIIAVIDVSSQAYGYKEELVGISLALAASVDAYATARRKGHPVIGFIVGNAISGGFLAHGLQSNRLIALDDGGINIQAMSKVSAARVTKRSVKQLEEASQQVPATAYDVKSFSTLGALFQLLSNVNADEPTDQDIATVRKSLSEAIESTRGKPVDLSSHRLQTKEALAGGRTATLKVRNLLRQQW